jgi:hypothetical protein
MHYFSSLTTIPLFGRLTIGAVNGAFAAAFAKVSSIHSKHGPFEMLLCVGDFFGSSSVSESGQESDSLKALLSGDVKGMEYM